jgi:hypothetical protein
MTEPLFSPTKHHPYYNEQCAVDSPGSSHHHNMMMMFEATRNQLSLRPKPGR